MHGQWRDSMRTGLVVTLLLLAAGFARAAESDVRRVWQMLDYLAVDYGGAVQGGVVIKASEFDEMREFAAASRNRLAALEYKPQKAALLADAAKLASAIDAREEPARVAELARSLGSHLLAAYPVSSSPREPPKVAAAAALYQAQCASCHGATGGGDGPLAARLEPKPIAFTHTERARERSVFALYQAISQGIEGTPMASFASIAEADRWALAFYVGQLSHSPADARKGEAVWRQNAALRSQMTSMDALVRASESDLTGQFGDEVARPAIAFLRNHPEAVNQARGQSFELAQQRLTQSLNAYEANDVRRAADLALSAYLDGVDPLEHALGARDSSLTGRIESAMSKYRSLLASKAPLAELRAQLTQIEALFADGEKLLSSGAADATAAFFGSFTILLREGIEALLVVVAMIAFLRKAERKDGLPYVHAGWVGALALGALTWAVATYAVGVSGASREVTEGLSSLFAAAVLVRVGLWMHQKSIAGRWQHYLRQKMSAALNKKSAWFLFGLSFVAVYREVFETILFYAALWQQGGHGALLAGLAAGAAVLLLIAVALLRFSKSLPIGQFFSWSSMLVAVLAVVLTGKGIAALQEAGWVNAYETSTPRIDFLGVYPSLQVLGAQLLVAAIVVTGFLWNARSAKRVGSTQ
jgi:high-affinity iron transporter